MANSTLSSQGTAHGMQSTRRRPSRLVDARSSLAAPARPAVRRRLILDTLVAIERSGHAVTAVRICASGDVLLLTGNQPVPDEPTEDLDWVAFAGQT